jgi:hypothetical protein
MAVRQTAVLFKRWLPSPTAPTQIILRELLKEQPLTTEQVNDWFCRHANLLTPFDFWRIVLFPAVYFLVCNALSVHLNYQEKPTWNLLSSTFAVGHCKILMM